MTVFFSLSPLILFWGFRVYADIPAMFFTVLSFYFLLKYNEIESNKPKNKKKEYLFLALCGITAALSFLSRFPLALFAISVGIYFILKKKPKELLIFALFFLIAICPWLIYNRIIYKNPIWDLLQQYTVVAEWTVMQPISAQLLYFLIALASYQFF